MKSSFDVVVIGSGFGGSLLATILQSSGLAVGLLDKSSHPRFAIGESSTPAADFLLEEIANTYDLEELRPLVRFGSWRQEHPEILCGCKRGFSYFWHGESSGFQACPSHPHELLVAANGSREQADTQWYRPDVDQYFVNVAKSRGVEVVENAQVTSIEHGGLRDWKVTYLSDGRETSCQASFLVDASGPAGVVMNHLQISDTTNTLSTTSHAVYSHWENLPPLSQWLTSQGASLEDYPYPIEDSVIHHLFRDGWMWQIRFENDRQSLGFVFADVPAETQQNPEQLWSNTVRYHPVLSEMLAGSQLATFPGRLFQTHRLQRLRSQAAGEDWAALPFTLGFIDPLHSTGIAQTLYGVHRLAQILLNKSVPDLLPALQEYSRETLAQFRLLDDLISSCYLGLRDFRLFTVMSMLYFAAATTFEQRWLGESLLESGFLLADDNRFREVVSDSKTELTELVSIPGLPDEAINQFSKQMKDRIEPWNSVGLFAPEVPRMYRYTAAK
ncbi:MAG: tryptophan 7-halogenase [Planctomycetaceae bacterium]|nr:tryptophan 7-halogenase [Planctomycetaceae bacterium]